MLFIQWYKQRGALPEICTACAAEVVLGMRSMPTSLPSAHRIPKTVQRCTLGEEQQVQPTESSSMYKVLLTLTE